MKRVVVIGGGFAGAYIAKHLEKDFFVTLIDAKDYFEFTPGILRTIVHTPHMKKVQILHSHYLHRAKLILGEVKDITDMEVLVGDKKVVYDYLFVCAGSRYNTPIKEKNIVLPHRASMLRTAHHQLQEAENILIVGGGIVGVELAGEILDFYPQKNITLVHAKECLMERFIPKIQRYVHEYLTRKGVTLIYNQRLEVQSGKFMTSSGEEIQTDLCFFCTGIIPNTEFFQKNFSSFLNKKKQVIVEDTLQLKHYPSIFVVGDLNNVQEEKTAQSAEKQARVAVQNVFALEKGQILVSYQVSPRIMIISLGRFSGLLIYKNFTFTGIVPALLKWFVEWKTMMRYR